MPWKEESVMRQRLELMKQLCASDRTVQEVCDQWGISRKTAYKWLKRYQTKGLAALNNRSRAPKKQALQVSHKIEAQVIEAHCRYRSWGPNKLRDYLIHIQEEKDIPSHTTIGRILKRNGCEVMKNNRSKPAVLRFERATANELWQMDFKGHFKTEQERCYPLTIIDDHSRYAVCLKACRNEQMLTVKERLIDVFRRYGLPEQINVDNGNPWGSSNSKSYTALQIWLLKLGIKVSHSAPYHPQTNGKDERFHRTLKLEVLHQKRYVSLEEVQEAFDEWQYIYNYRRPHLALGGEAPSSRYKESKRRYPERLLEVEYEEGAMVKRVDAKSGSIYFKGSRYRIGNGLYGEYIELKETERADQVAVFFMDQFIKNLRLKNNK
ncbi:MAG: IS481 family transposase [Gammaproteobacteria bacterium]|nr:IS481 family transposase [Gammaproteobacteria bacterium]MBU1558760.1 IS481 family transposase [Gammaproteobacteria bacterium]MBU2546061.1 IS481 family transposase [Gammaproteobacteria bacterium]